MRGRFGKIDKDEHREIAKRGGAGVPAEKRSFSQSKELAVRAGKIGGAAIASYNRSFYKNRNLAAEAGRKGGLASQKKKKEKENER